LVVVEAVEPVEPLKTVLMEVDLFFLQLLLLAVEVAVSVPMRVIRVWQVVRAVEAVDLLVVQARVVLEILHQQAQVKALMVVQPRPT
jgi:hypothetical protein